MLLLLRGATRAFPSVLFPVDVAIIPESGCDCSQRCAGVLSVFLFLEWLRIVPATVHYG